MWRSYQTSSNDTKRLVNENTLGSNKKSSLWSEIQEKPKEEARKSTTITPKAPSLKPRPESASLKVKRLNLTPHKSTHTSTHKRQFYPTDDQEREESETLKIRNMGNSPTRRDTIETYRRKVNSSILLTIEMKTYLRIS